MIEFPKVTKKERLQKRLVYFARKHLGKSYKYGARPWQAPRVFDCSSFTQYLYKRIGIDLPRTALEQAHEGRMINPRKEKLEVGDLIFLKGSIGRYDRKFPQGVGHVSLYVGGGKIIHAKWNKIEKYSKVRVNPISKILQRKDLIVIKRIL